MTGMSPERWNVHWLFIAPSEFLSALFPSRVVEAANVVRGVRVRDDEVVACLRSEAGRLTAVQMAELLGTLAPEGLSQGTIVTFFRGAFPEIPLRTLLDASGWSRVSGGGMSDNDFNRILRRWIPTPSRQDDEE